MHLIGAPRTRPHETHRPTSSMFARVAPLLDQSALLAALQRKKIAGAALDVTDPEPLPRCRPALESPNLLITPAQPSAIKRPPLAAPKTTFASGFAGTLVRRPQSLQSSPISTAATSGSTPHFECESEALALQE